MIPPHTTHFWNTRICSLVSCIFAFFMISTFTLLSPDALLAQVSTPLDAPGLTQALIAQSIRYQEASLREQTSLLHELMNTATSRKELLLSVIEENPGEVIRLAVPASIRAALPPSVQAYIERKVDIEGKLTVMYEDYGDHSRLLYHLETAGARLSLHFADHHPEHLLTGAKIRVKGIQVDNALALGGENVDSVTPAPVPSTLGDLRTLVVLVNFQDNPTEPYTVAEAQQAVFGTVSDFYLENSYRQTWLSGDVVGWFTIALTSTICDMNTLASQAASAASAAGVNLSAYTHHVYAFPKNACGGLGLSTVGGNPSQSWINGTLALGVIGHELGHALGVWHSHALDCGTAVLGPSCIIFGYGDTFDIMGNTDPGHFTAFQKERLGWLSSGISPQMTTVQSDGTYVIDSYEMTGTGPKALKILKSIDATTGQKTWYYVEYRQPIGFDGFLADYSNVLNGVLIHTGSEATGDSSYLLDMTPNSGSLNFQDWSDPALMGGQSFHDPDSGMIMTTQWVTATQAAVSVNVGSIPPQPDQTAVTVSTDHSSYTRTQTVTITARVTANGAAVANAAVGFKVIKSNGAVVTGSTTTGSNGTAVYKLRLKRQDPVGIYEASATDTSSEMPFSAVTTFTVQ